MTLRPNRFRPQAGARSRVRNVLHAALKEEATGGSDDDDEEEEIEE